jgi:hypothetical protein
VSNGPNDKVRTGNVKGGIFERTRSKSIFVAGLRDRIALSQILRDVYELGWPRNDR